MDALRTGTHEGAERYSNGCALKVRRPMTVSRRARLAELMSEMADGCASAVFDLASEFEVELEISARWHCRRIGYRPTDDDVASLVMAFAVELIDCAGSWSPDGGAMPWTWAYFRMHTVAKTFVSEELLIEDVMPEFTELADDSARICPDDEGPEETLARMSRLHPLLREVREVLDQLSGEKRATYLLYAVQKVQGDPAPSHTVAEQMGMTPANVRQIHKRVRTKLEHIGVPVDVA